MPPAKRTWVFAAPQGTWEVAGYLIAVETSLTWDAPNWIDKMAKSMKYQGWRGSNVTRHLP